SAGIPSPFTNRHRGVRARTMPARSPATSYLKWIQERQGCIRWANLLRRSLPNPLLGRYFRTARISNRFKSAKNVTFYRTPPGPAVPAHRAGQRATLSQFVREPITEDRCPGTGQVMAVGEQPVGDPLPGVEQSGATCT